MNNPISNKNGLIKPVLVGLALMVSMPLANAQRSSDDGSVKVSVTYEISMPKPEDAASLEEAMRKSREMVYSRVKLECVEMKRHIAETCELTQLDVNQGAKASRRSGKPGSLNVRANARYRIELKKSE